VDTEVKAIQSGSEATPRTTTLLDGLVEWLPRVKRENKGGESTWQCSYTRSRARNAIFKEKKKILGSMGFQGVEGQTRMDELARRKHAITRLRQS